MKEIIILIIYFIYSTFTPLLAQWSDNFSDNDFTSNPKWVGDSAKFIIKDEVLRLNASNIAGVSYLATSSKIGLEATWKFYIKLAFNPSSNNYISIYLMSDSANLENTKNGYFLQIGGKKDEVSLYKVANDVKELLIDGLDSRVNLSQVAINVHITHKKSGDWELKTKLEGEQNFISENIANDNQIKSSSYFGILCTYTSSRSNSFYIDDIEVIKNTSIDSIPPTLLSASTPSNTKILLVFNEAIDSEESIKNTYYSLSQLNPITKINAISSDSILLEFANKLLIISELHILSLPDLQGNKLDTIIKIPFIDTSTSKYRDLVINELFPDPTPQVGLPSFEFVELLNCTNKIINLEGWTFTDGSKTMIFNRHLIYPDSLVIISSNEAKSQYLLYGATIGASSWPTLNNDRDALKLINDKGVVVDSLTYTADWYKDISKYSGGWSLEQINPLSKCLGAFNWTASTAIEGGSPGKKNSVYSSNTDFTNPQIRQVLKTDSLLEIWFSEPLMPGKYIGSILPNNLQIVLEINTPTMYITTLLAIPLDLESSYSIQFPIEDCSGNKTIASTALISITPPKKGDLIINELLFNPILGGEDFIELVNTTANFYNLKGYEIANKTNKNIISDTTFLLYPYHYLAISKDIIFLKNQYLAPDSSLFQAHLPSMPNDEGVVLLKSNIGKTIDSVFYSSSFHFSLISNSKGISLERISQKAQSNDENNWRSAAETSSFATPGYKNSQSQRISRKGNITISPIIITPNNDGQEDYCQLLFDLNYQSQTISIQVYTINGQLIKTIANNALISSHGFFTWDGTNQQGRITPTAHYIIISKVTTSDGHIIVFKNKVVVANDF